MSLPLACILALAASASAAPAASYDQRQDGELNAQVDVQNVLILFALPKQIPLSILSLLSKSNKPVYKESGLMERSDIRGMEAFVEPNEPYHVEIGSDRAPSDGRAAEVVIPGPRHGEAEPQQRDELQLLGALENCGPNRVRDSITLTCRNISLADADSAAKPHSNEKDNEDDSLTPEVVSS